MPGRLPISSPARALVASMMVRPWSTMTDWLDLHLACDDPSSTLARRLEVVRRCEDVALEGMRCREPRMLSGCAGDGRDVIPVLAKRGNALPCAALLVEQDDELACRTTVAAARLG
jgi:hypothetical protein